MKKIIGGILFGLGLVVAWILVMPSLISAIIFLPIIALSAFLMATGLHWIYE